MKLCNKCGALKGDEEFYRSSGTAWCRHCFILYMRQRRADWKPPKNPPATKQCGHCKNVHPLSMFGLLVGTATGRHSWCRKCQAERARMRRRDSPNSVRRTKYGLQDGQYESMLSAQGGKCAICAATDRKLVIDHCHDTRIVRGLLCKPCNSALGFMGDSVQALVLAAEYVAGHREFRTVA